MGRFTVKVVPIPASLMTRICPLCRCTIFSTTVRPMPFPSAVWELSP